MAVSGFRFIFAALAILTTSVVGDNLSTRFQIRVPPTVTAGQAATATFPSLQIYDGDTKLLSVIQVFLSNQCKPCRMRSQELRYLTAVNVVKLDQAAADSEYRHFRIGASALQGRSHGLERPHHVGRQCHIHLHNPARRWRSWRELHAVGVVPPDRQRGLQRLHVVKPVRAGRCQRDRVEVPLYALERAHLPL
jgi:hypothetical protein